MKLSIIILNYNVRFFLELCLHSVARAIESIDAEIIVVDNASTDDSIKMIKQLFPKVILIENTENVGFAKANNQAASISKGEYICILNPDTVVTEMTFKKFLKFAEEKRDAGIIGCRLIDGSGNFLPESKRNVPTIRVSFKKLTGNPDYYYAHHIQENEVSEVEILVGALMFMKTSIFNDVKGFDEDYFMYAEDVDLSYKVLKAGYKNWYLGSETIIHFKGESTTKNFEYLKRFYGSMQIFYKKHFRKNIFFDALVWLGIRIIPIFKNEKEIDKIKSVETIVISASPDKELIKKLDSAYLWQKRFNPLKDNATYILDISNRTFSSSIDFMLNSRKYNNVKYRFLVPQSQFIIGSDNSENRGEIMQF